MPVSIIIAALLWLLVGLGGLGADAIFILAATKHDVDWVRIEIFFTPGIVVSLIFLVFALRTLTQRARDVRGAMITSLVVAVLLWAAVMALKSMSWRAGLADDAQWVVTFGGLRAALCLAAAIFAWVGRDAYKAHVG